jgi:hypothetical protein
MNPGGRNGHAVVCDNHVARTITLIILGLGAQIGRDPLPALLAERIARHADSTMGLFTKIAKQIDDRSRDRPLLLSLPGMLRLVRVPATALVRGAVHFRSSVAFVA